MAWAILGHLSKVHLVVKFFPGADAPSLPQGLNLISGWTPEINEKDLF